MTILSDEAKRLRLEVLRLHPGRGRKYDPALRRRILAWVDRARATGMLDIDCSNALGIPQHRFEIWREYEARDARREKAKQEPTPSVSLVPIETPPPRPMIQLGAGLAFVSAHGYRIEGLTYEQAFALLKEFE
jgi:hypothetical protein